MLLAESRSIAFGSGIPGAEAVLAIINSQFIDWHPPFGSFRLVAGQSTMTARKLCLHPCLHFRQSSL